MVWGPQIQSVGQLLATYFIVAKSSAANLITMLGAFGEGKTSQLSMLAKKLGVPWFLVDARSYGEMYAGAIPTPLHENRLAAEAAVKEAEVEVELAKLVKDDDGETDLSEKRAALMLKKAQAHLDGVRGVINTRIAMIIPQYKELVDFLKGCDNFVKKTGLPPLVVLDEAFQVTQVVANQICTDLVDGTLCASLGLSWRPVVLFQGNGKLFGGSADNNDLPSRIIARSRRFEFIGVPGPVPMGRWRAAAEATLKIRFTKTVDENSIAEVNNLDTWVSAHNEHMELLKRFKDQREISPLELAYNTYGQPRAMTDLATAILVAKIVCPQLGMKARDYILETYIPSAFLDKDWDRVRELVAPCFAGLPQTIAEIEHVVDGLLNDGWEVDNATDPSVTRIIKKANGGTTVCAEFQRLDEQDWMAFARHFREIVLSNPATVHPLEQFVDLVVPMDDIKKTIKTQLHDSVTNAKFLAQLRNNVNK